MTVSDPWALNGPFGQARSQILSLIRGLKREEHSQEMWDAYFQLRVLANKLESSSGIPPTPEAVLESLELANRAIVATGQMGPHHESVVSMMNAAYQIFQPATQAAILASAAQQPTPAAPPATPPAS